MGATNRSFRQSISLPARLARRVRSLAKAERRSANHVLVELIEEGMEARKLKERAFFDLAGRFRAAKDPAQVKALGQELGRFVFGE
jgi:predicted transcriptional regulator